LVGETKVDRERKEAETQRVIQAHGAQVATELNHLLPAHRVILAQITHKVIEYASISLEKEERIRGNDRGRDGETGSNGENSAYLEAIENAEPIYTFLLDGVRGSGKTTLALSICRFLDRFAQEQLGKADLSFRSAPLKWRDDDNIHLVPKWAVDGPPEGHQTARPLDTSFGRRASVHCLPLLRPDDMDKEESIMEAVFAKMLEELRQAADTAKRSNDDKRAADANKLRGELLRKVAKGWYFSQRLGVEALMNDSLSFDEYIERRGNEASQSHDRVRLWRKYVVKYLDFFRAQMLGIFVDDTDIARHLSQDLMHSIRMFFSHERIFSVVAGNLHATRQKLLADQMAQISDAYGTLRNKESYTARFWREFERDNLEEYLAKVFPRQHRHFITLQDADLRQLLYVPPSGDGDGARLNFSEFCTHCMRPNVPEMLQVARLTCPAESYTGGQAATRGGPTGITPKQARACENYLGFWLLRNHYADTLTPRSARHINQFHRMMAPAGESDQKFEQADPLNKQRRVAVTVFTAPSNYQVVQRLTDHDSSVVDWVNAQQISSCWRGGRWLKVNELKLPQTSPTYHFILYRLDLEFAKPDHAFQNANFPTSLLPQPAGRGVWTPEPWDAPKERQALAQQLFKAQEPATEDANEPGLIGRVIMGMSWVRQELQGLARTFGNPSIPANCIYFKDLRALPDLTWRWDAEDGDTRRRYGQFPVRNVDNTFRLQQNQPQNLYFRRIVLLYGSYPLMPPVPSDEFTRGTVPLFNLELSSLQLGEKNPITEATFSSKNAESDAKKSEDAKDTKKDETALKSEGASSDSHISQNDNEQKKSQRSMPQAAWIEDGGHLLASLIRYASLGHPTSLLDLLPESHEQFDARAMAKRAKAMGLRSMNTAEPVKDGTISKECPADGDAFRLATDILRIAPRYTRILDDVRRAYSALRIMEQDANDYAYAFGGTREAAGSSERTDHTAPFQLGRNDRIRLIDIRKFRECLGLNGDITDARSTDPRYAGESFLQPGQGSDSQADGTPVRGVWETLLSVRRQEPGENGSPAKDGPTKICIRVGTDDKYGVEIYHGFLSGRPDADNSAPWIKLTPGASTAGPETSSQDDESSRSENGSGPTCDTDAGYFVSDLLERTLNPRRPDGTKGQEQPSSGSGGDPWKLNAALRASVLNTRAPEATAADGERAKTHRDDVGRFRIMRSKLLFLWGVGPCLSSLIHLEAMGAIYARVEQQVDELPDATGHPEPRSSEYKTDKWQEARIQGFANGAKSALEVLDDWHTTLATAEALVYLGALALEINLADDFENLKKSEEEDSEKSKPNPKERQPQFRPMPDFSIHTLGLRLYDKPSPDGSAKNCPEAFGGIVRDVLMRLRIGQIYAEELALKINEALPEEANGDGIKKSPKFTTRISELHKARRKQNGYSDPTP
jgi:hypothetical protein